MKKQHVWIVGILIVVCATFVFWPRPSDHNRVLIGAILPLSGDAAEYGKNDKDGIDLAVDEYNRLRSPNTPAISVIYEDCGTDPKRAISAFKKLRSQGVSLMIDDAISSISLALTPMLANDQTVLISTGASNPSLTGASPYFFRIWNSDAFEGEFLADYLKGQKQEVSLSILAMDSDYGKGLQTVMTQQLAGSSVRVIHNSNFPKDTKDFRSIASVATEQSPTQIYLVGYAAQTGPCAKQLRELGYKGQILGTVAMEDAQFVQLAGIAAEGVIYPFPVAPTGRETENFKIAFEEKYKKPPQLLNDCGYDAANLLIEAIRAKHITGEMASLHLRNLGGYHGASGLIKFTNGDVKKPLGLKVIKNGKFTLLQ